MDSDFKYHPPGIAHRRLVLVIVMFATAALFGTYDWGSLALLASSVGVSTISFIAAIPSMLIFALLLFYGEFSYERKQLKRAIEDELCWGCMYSLKGCPSEDSLCPECGLPRSGSKNRWALWRPHLLNPRNGFVDREKEAQRAKRTATRR
jgi:hypothetical protein